jgi:hypothetical protein
MLEYLRMVRGGGKEGKDEPEKGVDTASLITALHPFGTGG